MEPIRLTEGVPRDVCQCGDPTVVHLVSYPTWYLYPPARLPHRRHQDIHLAWSFEGKDTLQWCHMCIMTSQVPGYSTVRETACSVGYQCLLCIADLCEGNSPMTWGFPSQRACNAKRVFMVSSLRIYRFILYMRDIVYQSPNRVVFALSNGCSHSRHPDDPYHGW